LQGLVADLAAGQQEPFLPLQDLGSQMHSGPDPQGRQRQWRGAAGCVDSGNGGHLLPPGNSGVACAAGWFFELPPASANQAGEPANTIGPHQVIAPPLP